MNRRFIIVFLLLIGGKSFGQNAITEMSLSECIEYAWSHNINVKISELTAENNQAIFDNSRFLKYPSLNGQVGINANGGRNVNPYTNEIVTQTIGTNNLGLAAAVPIYDGKKNVNTISKNQSNLQASVLDIQTQKNNLALQVSLSYLNIMATEDLIDVAQKQLETSTLQIEKTRKLVANGALAETNLYDLESQIANDELNLVNSQNNLELAILTLKQNMNAPYEMNLKVKRMAVENPEILTYPEKPHNVFLTAVGFLPEIKAGDLRVKAAERNIAIAHSIGLPSLSLTGSLGTSYSTIAKNITGTESNFIPLSATAVYQGQTVPLTINLPQQSYSYTQIPYFEQFGNNTNLNLGLSLRVPIFNAFNQKYQTQSARIMKVQQEMQNQNTKLAIKQNIDQAFINMKNAQKKYIATLTQKNALEKSYKASELKFGNGANTFVDYNLAKTNLDRAKSNLVIAKYDYMFRLKILDFYQNKPLE